MDGVGAGRRRPQQIAVGRARLAVDREGVGGPPHVVFLHTGISDRRSWEGVSALLSPDMDVVAYDRRGFGATTYKAERHDQLVDLAAVLDSLGMERVVLVGNSRGGQIALDFTLSRAERVAALVLVAPSISGAPPVEETQVDPVEQALWATLEAADNAGTLEALNRGEIRVWLDGPHGSEGRVGGASRELALEMNRIALHAKSPGSEPEPPDAWSQLSDVRCPVLVVVGNLDFVHIRERSRQLASRIDDARLAVMEGTAHLPAFEQPAAFAALLRDFLRPGA